MPYINVDEAYILDNTGQQVDNSVDYANANSNRNLLDNPFFTVNQRNFTTGEGTEAGLALVDRWQAIRATVTRNTDNSLTVTPTQAQYGICQFIEQSRLKVGKTYTMSALIDNQYYSGSFVFSTSPASEYFATFSNGIRFYRHVANNKVDVWVIRDSTTAFAVQAVKLELGSYSTLINDTPPDYGEEFRKCARYFFRAKGDPLAFGYIAGTKTEAYVGVITAAPMRAQPSVAVSGSVSVRVQGYTHGVSSITSISNPISTGCSVGLKMNLSETASAIGACVVYPNANSYIDLSADL